jgi:hypothetical protein
MATPEEPGEVPNVFKAMQSGDLAGVRAWLQHLYIGDGGAMNQVALWLLARLAEADGAASRVEPVIGGDGPPIASCLLCGVNGPLATWYGSTRAGVCQDCRDARTKYQELLYEVARKHP